MIGWRVIRFAGGRTFAGARLAAVGVAAALVAACAQLSPAPAPAPLDQALLENYDPVAARAATVSAAAALDGGDLAAAEQGFEAALRLWPIDDEAWRGLILVYRIDGDQAALDYARFFSARMAWINDTHPRMVAAALRNVTAGLVEDAPEDPRTQPTAQALIAFLDQEDAAAQIAAAQERRAQLPPREAFMDSLGVYPAAVVGAATVGAFIFRTALNFSVD